MIEEIYMEKHQVDIISSSWQPFEQDEFQGTFVGQNQMEENWNAGLYSPLWNPKTSPA